MRMDIDQHNHARLHFKKPYLKIAVLRGSLKTAYNNIYKENWDFPTLPKHAF